MAETISFSSGGFSIVTNPQPGSNDVVAAEGLNGAFTLSTANTTPIVNLGIKGDDTAQDLSLFSLTDLTAIGLTSDLGGGDDNLFIGGITKASSLRFSKQDDTLETEGAFRNSFTNAGAGSDNFSFNSETEFVAVNSQINMGSGNDTLVFGGNIKNVDVRLGTGSDKVEFQGNINGASLNLGNDDQVDRVLISEGVDIQGLVITGAGESDLLFIGSTKFNYDGDSNLWVNSTDPSDTLNFS